MIPIKVSQMLENQAEVLDRVLNKSERTFAQENPVYQEDDSYPEPKYLFNQLKKVHILNIPSSDGMFVSVQIRGWYYALTVEEIGGKDMIFNRDFDIIRINHDLLIHSNAEEWEEYLLLKAMKEIISSDKYKGNAVAIEHFGKTYFCEEKEVGNMKFFYKLYIDRHGFIKREEVPFFTVTEISL